ncbi:putative hydrolase [Keratinibaculum paraultunense]|uniref:Putative hydrolase n=1 Tax=Keratinibaculum paraultunense TaxID=1278232 RepID=A0A4R3KUZ5_9FIRM|nr:PHP domain-containing protein [Keratinibaculum paraultunense]QQY79103.1 PHP domain-containing protein [Keratinibaculum paraultunense]TCS88485.1 putative hydrolase [Keratinibaculum paraultunense]
MQIIGDYHTHTIYSHGKGTIRENVEVSIEKGLKEIAICDHGPGHIIYGIKRDNIFKMRKEIDELNKEYKEINILLGIEANVMDYDGNIDVDDSMLEVLDILLLGFHYGIIPNNIKSMWYFYGLNYLSKVLPFLNDNMVDLNTKAVIKAIEKYPIDIITHPGSKAKLDIEKVGEVAYKHNTALEINSHHSQLSVENIKKALNTKVKFYINSDAHHPSDVGELQQGIQRALEAKVPICRIVNAKE